MFVVYIKMLAPSERCFMLRLIRQNFPEMAGNPSCSGSNFQCNRNRGRINSFCNFYGIRFKEQGAL